MSIDCAGWLDQLREYAEWRRSAVPSDAAEGERRCLALLVHSRECASCSMALVTWLDDYAAELAAQEEASAAVAIGLRFAERMGELEDELAAARSDFAMPVINPLARVGAALAAAGDDFLTGLAALKDWVVARTTFDYVGALAAPGVRGHAGATADRALSYLEIPELEQGGWRSQVEVSAQHELRMVFEPQKGVADDELAVLRAAVRTKSGEWLESPAEPGLLPIEGDRKRRYQLVVWSSLTERFDDVFESTEGNIAVWFEKPQ